ncbi:hypothetical protein CGCTS75_v000634 [Colletotrichum tropicale]|nr:hypothetical protein CGCTS75_v000634 [Colletotrichum tropicale]
MRFSTLFSIASLSLAAQASPMRRDDPHRADFRIWSETGCGQNGSNEGNLGVWTTNESQTNQCQPTFNAQVVKGIFLNDIQTDDQTTCTMYAYTEENCGGVAQVVSVKECANVPDGDASFVSFNVECNAPVFE